MTENNNKIENKKSKPKENDSNTLGTAGNTGVEPKAKASVSQAIAFSLKDTTMDGYSYPDRTIWKYNKTDTFETHNVGIAKYTFIPTYGYSAKPTDPINIWGRNIMTSIRNNVNKRVDNYYSDSDVVIEMTAYESFYLWMLELERLYKLMTMDYEYKNKSIPAGVIKALGYSWSDLDKHRSGFRSLFTSVASIVAKLNVAKFPTFADLHIELMRNVFVDDEIDEKAQLIVFQPAGYYKYNAIGSSTGSTATWLWALTNPNGTFHNQTAITFDQIYDYTMDLINGFHGDQEFDTMNGDLKSLAEKTSDISLMYDTPIITTDAKFSKDDVFTYNKDILYSLHNAQIYGIAEAPYMNEVIPEPSEGSPYLTTGIKVDINAQSSVKVIDIGQYEDNTINRILATRFTIGGPDTITVQDDYQVQALRSEILCPSDYYDIEGTRVSNLFTDHIFSSTESLKTWLQQLHYATKFGKGAPLLNAYWGTFNSSGTLTKVEGLGMIGDYNYAWLLTPDSLLEMARIYNIACMMEGK